jgi:hypothetical protein
VLSGDGIGIEQAVDEVFKTIRPIEFGGRAGTRDPRRGAFPPVK